MQFHFSYCGGAHYKGWVDVKIVSRLRLQDELSQVKTSENLYHTRCCGLDETLTAYAARSPHCDRIILEDQARRRIGNAEPLM
jgi:hypothetical protein